MNFQGIEICCPHCRGELVQNESEQQLHCESCNQIYPIILGIPDLRIFPDPYIDFEADRAKGIKVGVKSDELGFTDLIEYYYSITGVVPPQHARQYTQGLLAATNRSQTILNAWLKESAERQDQRPSAFLEIGCGTGPMLTAAAPYFNTVIGVDIAFRWLVVAKKRLAEAGLSVPLICACAEALPFPDNAFDTLVSESTIEHVKDQVEVTAESYRVMVPGAKLFLTTPNRFSLGPDPQVGIWAGSWLPKSWLAALVKHQGGIPPERYLLSASSLKQLLTRVGFRQTQITLPSISASQRSNFRPPLSWLIDLYNWGRHFYPTRQFLLLFGPMLNGTAEKPDPV